MNRNDYDTQDHIIPTAINVVRLVASPEVAQLVGKIFESRMLEVEFRRRIEKISLEFEQLSRSHDAMNLNRDKDRDALVVAVNILIECGQYDIAANLFKEFIQSAPAFSKDVVSLILDDRSR